MIYSTFWSLLHILFMTLKMELKEKNGRFFSLLDMLPTIECIAPRNCLPMMKADTCGRQE